MHGNEADLLEANAFNGYITCFQSNSSHLCYVEVVS